MTLSTSSVSPLTWKNPRFWCNYQITSIYSQSYCFSIDFPICSLHPSLRLRFTTMPISLLDLPPELLNDIVSYIELAKTLNNLARTCRLLHDYVQHDGFRVFVQSRFPSLETPPYWKSAAHALTTLSRDWDRKAFIVWNLEKNKHAVIRGDDRGPARFQGARMRQSMGFRPSIDCFEVTGDSWDSRREVLAWAAGAELVVRQRSGRFEQAKAYWKTSKDFAGQWTVWKPAQQRDGHDDITSLNLLRPYQVSQADEDIPVIIGRASGCLDLVQVSESSGIQASFETEGRTVRSAHVSPSDHPLLAACLSDSVLSLYPVEIPATPKVNPVAELTVIEPDTRSRTWTTRFLSPNRLAVGRGPSREPLCIYNVTPTGFSGEPRRNFGNTDSAQDSVYSFMPLSFGSSQAGGDGRNLFLSGWFSGNIKLHDLRVDSPGVMGYADRVDYGSAIYSLIAFGHERFVAGGARHSLLKVFDLRMSGSKRYYAADLEACSQDPAPTYKRSCCAFHAASRSESKDYNVYLNASRYRNGESPVYALGAASNFSTSFYAGIENKVLQIDLVSLMDKYPEMTYRYNDPPLARARAAAQNKSNGTRLHDDKLGGWQSDQKICLVEQPSSELGSGFKLMRQRSRPGRKSRIIKGWDEGWINNS